MASHWEKVAGSRNRVTKANKSLFIKTGAATCTQHQFKVKWQWSHQTKYQKTLKDLSSALEFYEGIRIAIPASEWDKTAMRENSRLLRRFLENTLAERVTSSDPPMQEKTVEISNPAAVKGKEINLTTNNEEKTAA